MRSETIELDRGKDPAKEVAWLGVSTEEAPEALISQLALESGEGLVVIYVAADSPAAKAGIEKYDVLVELGDQLLVHPAQLRKLIQAKKEGDGIQLSLYRRGKKQTVSATLARSTEHFGMLPGASPGGLEWQFDLGEGIGKDIHEQMKSLHGAHSVNNQEINLKVQHSIENASKTLREAMRHNNHAISAFGPGSKDLEALAQGGVEIDNDATVVVRKAENSTKKPKETALDP